MNITARKLSESEHRLAFFAPGAFFVHILEYPDGGERIDRLVSESLQDFVKTNYSTQRQLEAVGRACAKALKMLNPDLPRLNAGWDPDSYLEGPEDEE